MSGPKNEAVAANSGLRRSAGSTSMGSLTGSNLAMHPRRFGDGPELPLGTYTVVELSDGVWTVERRIGAERWYPLRADRAWRTWRSWQSCKRDVYDDAAMAYTCGDWPHWGSLS